MVREHVALLLGSGVTSDSPARAPVLPRWLATLRSSRLKDHSLRQQIDQLVSDERHPDGFMQAMGRRCWKFVAHPAFAVGAVLVVVLLAVTPSSAASFTSTCLAPAVLCGDGARDFLGLLWEVLAGALGLTVAASLFAFESASQQRPSSGLRTFTERSGMVPFVMLGAAGLGAVGAVLVFTEGTPPVSAAATATLLAGAEILLFPVFLRRALNVINPHWFHRDTLHRVSISVRDHVRMEARRRVANHLLDEAVASIGGVEHRAYSIDERPPLEVAPVESRVFDVDLSRLKALAGADVRVRATVDDTPRANSNLIEGDGVEIAWRPAFTLIRDNDSELIDEAVEGLHAEAVHAIENATPAALERVADVYVEMLTAWPRAWEELGLPAAEQMRDSRHIFGHGPVDEVSRDLYEQLQRAQHLGLREHIYALITIPTRAGYAAAELEARDLLAALGKIATQFGYLADPSSPHASLIADRAWRFHIDTVNRHAVRHLERGVDSITDEAREMWLGVAVHHLGAATGLLKVFAERGFREAFVALREELVQVADLWQMSSAEMRAQITLEHADGDGHTFMSVEEAERTLKFAAARERIVTVRDAGLLSVLAWQLREHQSGDAPTLGVELVDSFGDVGQLLRAADHAMSHDSSLSNWMTMAGPSGVARSIDSGTPVLRAVAFVLLARSSEPTHLPPVEWLRGRRDSLQAALLDDQVQRQAAEWSGQTSSDVAAKAQRIGGLVEGAATEAELLAENAIIEATLDSEKVADLRRGIVKSWRESRTLPELASRIEVTTAPPKLESEHEWGVRQRVSKRLLMKDGGWGSVDSVAESVGQALGRGELGTIVGQVVEVAPYGVAGAVGSPAERLAHLLSELRRRGFRPSLVALPLDWSLREALSLPTGRNEGLGGKLIGEFEDVLVVADRQVPDRRMFAADIASAFEIFDSVGEDEVPANAPVVDVEVINRERALEMVASWGVAESETEAKVRELQQELHLTALRKFSIEVRAPLAVGSVWWPPT